MGGGTRNFILEKSGAHLALPYLPQAPDCQQNKSQSADDAHQVWPHKEVGGAVHKEVARLPQINSIDRHRAGPVEGTVQQLLDERYTAVSGEQQFDEYANYVLYRRNS